MLSESASSISELNCYIKALMDNDEILQSIYVVGEISNFKIHSSGHMYFSLKDDKCSIRCIIFSKYVSKINFSMEDGIKIFAYGSVSCYEVSGQYQIYIYHVSLAGIGKINESLKKLYKKLEKEGLFDNSRKKKLKKFPRKIGVISSKTGAVIHDISSVLKRRFPIAEIVLAFVSVQGTNSFMQISNAIDGLQKISEVDVIIIARGGGSIEDLWAFNNEQVIRKIVNCKIPIISAVGHEIDFTLCDYASDLRAATPSVAAELSSESVDSILNIISNFKQRAKSFIDNKLLSLKSCLKIIENKFDLKSISSLIQHKKSSFIFCKKKIDFEFRNLLKDKILKLNKAKSRLNIFDPEVIFKRGYSVIKKDDKIVDSVEKIENGCLLKVFLRDGSVSFIVRDLKKEYKLESKNI